MPNLVKKLSISLDLAQKMVDAAVAKARQLGVTENVVILDDDGNLKAFGRMDGAPLPTIEMAQNKAYTALLGVSAQDFFNFIQGDPSLLAGVRTLSRIAAWGGGSHQGEWRTCRCDRDRWGTRGGERHRLRESSAGGRVRWSRYWSKPLKPSRKPMDAEQCVAEGLRALREDRSVIVPGKMNRFMNAVIPASFRRTMTVKMFDKVVPNHKSTV